jgi:hypothetical protein
MRRLLAPLIACIVTAADAAAETDPLAAWAGTWRGRCEIISSNQSVGFDASLTIAPLADGAYTWRLVYEASKVTPREVRDYEMVPVDAAKGHYELDEKNGLRLDTFVAGRAMYTYFMISGHRILGHDELLSEDEMLMNLPAFDGSPVRQTCLTGNEARCVDSFQLKSAQNCRLRRDR